MPFWPPAPSEAAECGRHYAVDGGGGGRHLGARRGPGTEEANRRVKLLLELGAGAEIRVNKNGYTAAHGAVHRGGSVPILRLLVEHGARLDVRNSKGWTPLTIAEGVEYTPDIFKRYPETAEVLRGIMRDQGLPVPEPNQNAAVGSSRKRRE